MADPSCQINLNDTRSLRIRTSLWTFALQAILMLGYYDLWSGIFTRNISLFSRTQLMSSYIQLTISPQGKHHTILNYIKVWVGRVGSFPNWREIQVGQWYVMKTLNDKLRKYFLAPEGLSPCWALYRTVWRTKMIFPRGLKAETVWLPSLTLTYSVV